MAPGSKDLGPLLESWAYDEQNSVRRIKALDGREVLQVRLPLGMEQYEINGRPDGLRPKNQESWLEYYKAKSQARQDSFTLDQKQIDHLYQEGLLYYNRYLLFFQIQEYALCARDTQRNLQLLEFVSRFSEIKQAETLEQYRPYILRMNVMARALLHVQEEKDIPAALRLLEGGMKAVEALPSIEDNQVFAFEKARSLQSLADLHSQLVKHAPLPEDVILEQQIRQAVRDERYEQAAMLRDKLRELRGDGYKTQR